MQNAEIDRGAGTGIVEWARRIYIPKEYQDEYTTSKVVHTIDGYIRKTPVQGIRIPEWYRKRLGKRIIASLIFVLVALALIYVLVAYVF